MIDARQYRQRDSEDILKEQQLLERLKRESRLDGAAWWEWSVEAHCFVASKQWQVLTGYHTADIFPMVDRSTPIEDLLDVFADRWLGLVHESDRAEAKEAVEKFIIFSRSSNYFEFGYQLKRKNGTYIHVLTIARSVWAEGKLQSLFAQTVEIGRFIEAKGAAAELVKQRTQINRNKLAISQIDIAAIVRRYATVALAALLAIKEVLPEILEQWRSIDVLLNPVLSEPTASDPKLTIFGELSEGKVQRLTVHLKTLIASASVIELGVYYPSESEGYFIFPGSYRVILKAQPNKMSSASFTETPQSVNSSPAIAARTEAHISGEAYLNVDSNAYSLPFNITKDGRHQLLFLRVVKKKDLALQESQAVDHRAEQLIPVITRILGEN